MSFTLSDNPTVYIPDLHGHVDKLDVAVDYYDNHYGVPTYVFLGDEIDKGEYSRETLELIKGLGDRAVNLWSNHTYPVASALWETDPDERIARLAVWLGGNGQRGYEERTLESYGLIRYPKNADTAKAFEERIALLGHDQIFRRMRMYHMEAGRLAIHGGLEDTSTLYEQLRALRAIDEDIHHSSHYAPEPPQITEFPGDQSALAGRYGITLITGHDHRFAEKSTERMKKSKNGRHIALASDLKTQPLYVWSTAEPRIRVFT